MVNRFFRFARQFESNWLGRERFDSIESSENYKNTLKLNDNYHSKGLNQPCLQEKRSYLAKIGFRLRVRLLSECCRLSYCNSSCHHFRLHFPIWSTFHRFHQYHYSNPLFDNFSFKFLCKNDSWFILYVIWKPVARFYILVARFVHFYHSLNRFWNSTTFVLLVFSPILPAELTLSIIFYCRKNEAIHNFLEIVNFSDFNWFHYKNKSSIEIISVYNFHVFVYKEIMAERLP